MVDGASRAVSTALPRLAPLVLAALSVAACGGGGSGGPAALDAPAGPVIAVVSRADLTRVVTVPAVVSAGSPVVLTSPRAGVVTAFGSRTIEYAGTPGRATFRLPAGVSMVEKLVPVGRRVPTHFPVARATVDGFALVATLDEATLYQLYSPVLESRGQVKNGPGPFDCPLANPVPGFTEAGKDTGSEGTLTVTCVIPGGLSLFAGMPAVMALTTASVRDVLTLPVEAIAGTVEHGTVLIVTPNGPREHDVTLGPTDGVRIQIKSGLSEGDRVQVPGPSLPNAS